MSKVFSGIGTKLFGHGPGAPAPLPADDSVAKAQAQADVARNALIARAGAGRSGTTAAGLDNAYHDQMDLMAKKVQRNGAATDLVG